MGNANPMNHYPRHIGDYSRDCAHLTLLEHGVYARLLDVYYAQERGIDASDLTMLARRLGARTDEEKAALSAVLTEFFHPNDEGLLVNKRAENELQKYKSFADRQRLRVQKRYTKPTGNLPAVEKNHVEPTAGMPPEENPYTNQNQNQNQNHILPSVVKRTRKVSGNVELPADWIPTANHAELAIKRGRNLSEEAEAFRAYHLARGNKFKSWDQAFNSWLRNAYGNKPNDHRTEKRSREFAESIVLPRI